MTAANKPDEPKADAKKKKRRISKAIKIRIITELACFTSPSDIRDLIMKEYGVVVNPTTIVYYDPTTAESRAAEEWRTLFFAARKKFIDDTSRVAISHRSFRLRRQDRLARIVEEKLGGDIATKNPIVFDLLVGRIQQLDEQAAKEVGDAFTNKRMLIAGDPEIELAKALGITVEELRLAIAAQTDGDQHG